MNTISTKDVTSFTCTCVHGGGGHMPACALFVPSKEQYTEACRERDVAREVVKAAVVFLDAYDEAGGLGAAAAEARALDEALDTLTAVNGTGETVRPWWLLSVSR